MTRDQWERAIGLAQKAGDQPAVQDLIQQASAELNLAGPAGLMANVGAGTDTFIQGAKQLVGMGPSDDELREKRRIDQMAAASTPGGGAAQIVGEALPSLMLPGGTGAKVLTKALNVARPGTIAAQAGGRIGLPMAAAGSALEGVGAAAFMPTLSNESTLGNLGVGAGFGAGAPVLGKALAAAGRGAYGLGERALAAAPGGVGERAAERVGARGVDAALRGADVPMDPRRYAAQNYQPNTLTGRDEFAPSTAAAYNQTPQLAAVEKATRQFDAPGWKELDDIERAKRWERLNTNLRTEGDVTAATRRADQMTPPYDLAGPKLWETNMAGFTRNLENLVGSADYISNPKFQNAVDFLRKRIEMGTITPQIMHGFRKTLAEGLAGPPGVSDAAIRAGKNDPAILRLMTSIDNVMEGSIPARNRGAWGDWRADYSANLAEGEAAKAESQMRRAWVDEHGRPLTGAGAVPDVTMAKLQREADAIRRVESGPRTGQQQLSPQAERAISDIVENLRATGIVQEVTKAATLGGSATAHNLAVMGMTGVLGELMFDQMIGGGVAGVLVGARSRANTEAAKRAILTRIMQDPAQFRQFIAQSAQRAQALAQHQGVSGSTRYGGAAATATLPAIDPETQGR